jgi:hypothetical protein
MLADMLWLADGLMLASVALLFAVDRLRQPSRAAGGASTAQLDELDRRAQAVFERWAGPGARLVEEPVGRWTAHVPVRPGGPLVPLAISAPTRRADQALLDALRVMAIEAPREVTQAQDIYGDWCVHHNGSSWNVHIPCRRCGHTRIPLPYTDTTLVDVARLLARHLHRAHAHRGTCPACVGERPVTVVAA